MYKKEKKYRGRSISFSNHSLSSTLPGMGSDLADCPPSRQLCLYSLILTKLHFPYFNIPPLLLRVAFCDKKGTPGSNQVKKTQKGLSQKMSLIIKIWHDFKVSWSSKQKGAGSFHIHRKTMKDLWALAVLGVRELPNLAQNLVTHSQW